MGPGTWAPRHFPLNDVFLDANGMYAGQVAGEIELQVKVREKERARPGGGVEDSERARTFPLERESGKRRERKVERGREGRREGEGKNRDEGKT